MIDMETQTLAAEEAGRWTASATAKHAEAMVLLMAGDGAGALPLLEDSLTLIRDARELMDEADLPLSVSELDTAIGQLRGQIEALAGVLAS
ncbi:hypothetical protein K3163_05555 [Qipengyuania sp. 1NDW9]|uniref:hypothetical protein n=1 Tax=Qipengyuania xiapuensis TaxID=2867236 RepID=UPI001C86B821|nr:hypothetical protein [Qipengyuania xiapuensis]MBX7492668.1 hypothetical protein [Qipengyuania xiapuensis]